MPEMLTLAPGIEVPTPDDGAELRYNQTEVDRVEFQSTRPVRGATAKVYKITLHTFATKGNF